MQNQMNTFFTKDVYDTEIYSDSWELDISRQNPNDYRITNLTHLNTTITLTRSLEEFVHRFLQGGVFEDRGLYAWHEEVMKG